MKRAIIPFVLALSALALAASGQERASRQYKGFRHFPKGADPREVGTRVAERFIASAHGNFGDRKPAKTIIYPEVCTWYGALRFAHAVKDTGMLQALEKRFEPFFSSEASLVPVPDHVDHTVFGTVPLELYILTGDQKYLRFGLSFPDAQWGKPFGHFVTPESAQLLQRGLSWQTRMWIDDMFMITAVETAAFRATGDTVYLNRAAREMTVYLDSLQRPGGLFYHAPDVPFYWGRGNGWVATGMTELLEVLPQDHPARARIMEGYRTMMKALLQYQTKDGLWRQLIDDPASWEETSGSGMFAYAMIMGVRKGWLPSRIYGPAARKAWLGLVSRLDSTAAIRDVSEGTNKRNDRTYYLERKRITGDLHGQAPVLWCATALVE